MTTLPELPFDILLLIGSFLDPASYTYLSSTCTALSDPSFAHAPSYWRHAVRRTFRVPNQPVAALDGPRWKTLYIRLRKSTRPYTWGNNAAGNLGHSYVDNVRWQQRVSWPMPMDGVEKVGVVADLQAGGWCTVFLTARGEVWLTGRLDGLSGMQSKHLQPTKLAFPPGWTTAGLKAETAIEQFSTGRAHILGLSDSGRIWSWYNADEPAINVKFLDVDLTEGGGTAGRSLVKKVVAGWNKSAALVEGTGIVVWNPVKRSRSDGEMEDSMLVLITAVVPLTGWQRSIPSHRMIKSGNLDAAAASIGEVLDFILLEDYIVFHTHLGRAFVSQIDWTNLILTPSVEVLPNTDRLPDPLPDIHFITSVQGSYNNFALFTRSGAVLTGTKDTLRHRTPFLLIPALQNTNVISLAFGDYHFLALHAEGHITSYGTESQGCGSLGLGGRHNPEGRLRGMRYTGGAQDGRLVPHAYTSGRRVWFEREKKEWIKFLLSGGRDPSEAVERMRATQDPRVLAEVSEWIEQEGNAWDTKFGQGGEGRTPFFALSVAAAGWHSGSLVVVDEDAAARTREACIVREHTDAPDEGQWWGAGLTRRFYNALGWVQQEGRGRDDPIQHGAAPDRNSRYVWADDAFPRLELSDGTVMAGTAELATWRNGRPEWDLSFTAYS